MGNAGWLFVACGCPKTKGQGRDSKEKPVARGLTPRKFFACIWRLTKPEEKIPFQTGQTGAAAMKAECLPGVVGEEVN